MFPLDPLRRLLEDRPAVVLAVLFGSRARDRARPGSDVDVGVELEGDELEELRALEVALSRAVGRFVDVVDLAKAPPLLRFEIARDGVVLLEREPYRWADFKARAMRDWWDWAPYARRIHAAAMHRLRQEAARGPA